MNDENPIPTPAPVQEPAPAAPAAEPVVVQAVPQAPPATPFTPAPQPAPQPAPLPVEASDRTKEQFDKLVESNARLAEANAAMQQEALKRSEANQQFAPLQTPPAPAPQVAPVEQINPADFVTVDPISGERYVDEAKLKEKMDEVTDRATKAEQAVNNYIQTSEQREVERQEKEAYVIYPELDQSTEKFDANLHKQTRALIYDSLINPQDYNGRPLTLKEAADVIKQQVGQGAAPVAAAPTQTPEEAQAAQGAQDAKEQAALAASGQQPEIRQNQQGEELLKRLSKATRLGDDEALAIRLANSDHIGTPSSSEES